VFGNVVNVASRMETTAKPGEILLTRGTYEEIREYINCTALGNIQVKGVKDPILAYSADSVKENALKLQQLRDEGRQAPAQIENLNLQEVIVAPRFNLPVNLPIDSHIPETLQRIFQDLMKAGEQIASDYHQENAFNSFLQGKWNELMQSLSRTEAT